MLNTTKVMCTSCRLPIKSPAHSVKVYLIILQLLYKSLYQKRSVILHLLTNQIRITPSAAYVVALRMLHGYSQVLDRPEAGARFLSDYNVNSCMM